VIGQMLSAWVLTMPGAGVLGGVAWEIADLFGAHSNAGAIVICLLAALAAFGLWTLSRRNPVSAADLDRTNVTVVEEAERAGVPAAVAVL
jgi:PiT family inorganic phosphate transporter